MTGRENLDRMARRQHGEAWILDARDGSWEKVGARSSVSVITADATAYQSAVATCKRRNKDEGWLRFLPVPQRCHYRIRNAS